jgi:hypothetical protein
MALTASYPTDQVSHRPGGLDSSPGTQPRQRNPPPGWCRSHLGRGNTARREAVTGRALVGEPCGCCCHSGIGVRTLCKHCWPADPSLLDMVDDSPHADDCRCEICRPDIIRLAP